MPLWSVEEWRARIGSSWAALGRTFPSCQSGHKEWRPSRRGGGEGGPMVVSTVPVTTFMLMCTTVSVTVAQPAVDDGHSPMFHNVSSYHGNKSSGSSYKSSGSWEHTSNMVTVFWKKLSCSSVKQLAGALLPKDLSLLRKNILSSIFTFSVLAFSLLVALQLKRATFQASLLARCGDIEPNPGPLGREDYVPKLKDVVVELNGVDDHALGIQLEVPVRTLRNISRDYATADRRLSEVIQYWMNNNQSISWMEIITALERIGGHQNIIDKIKSDNIDNITVTPSQMGQAVENKVLGTAKANFSSLLVKVQSSLEDHKIPVKKVRRFLMGIFEGGCNISKEGDMDDIFDAITKEQLWSYDNYGPLEKLAVNFLPTSNGTRLEVTKYESQLSAFQATTKIIDFIKLYKLEDCDCVPNHLFSPKENNSHHQRLTVGLRQERVISRVTLEHMNKSWELLVKDFCLPPLRAVIDRNVKGGLKITWLLLPHTMERITATYFKSIDFLQQHDIISIDLYRDSGNCRLTLYRKQSMVTGATPLFRASFTGDIDEVKNLLEGGVNVDKENTNADGYTPLIGASMTGQDDIARLLLRHRADVDYQAKRGLSALMVASMYNHPSTALLLLEHGAKVDLSDDAERTPLMEACMSGSTATVRVLLEHGANVDLSIKTGETALNLAASKGYVNIVKMLVDHGASADLGRNGSGLTALKLAQSERREDICDIQLQYSQEGPKVISPTESKESSEVKPQPQEAEVDNQIPSEDTQPEKRESEEEKGEVADKLNTELTEAQAAEVRSVRERLWMQIKKILLTELVKKEEATKIRNKSEHIIAPTKQRRTVFSRLFPRRGHRPVVGTAPAPEQTDCDITDSTQQDKDTGHGTGPAVGTAPVPEQTGHEDLQ